MVVLGGSHGEPPVICAGVAALRYKCDVAAHLPPTFTDCYGDVDGNGFVNPGDRGFVAANIEPCSPLPNYQNGSGMNAAGDGPDGRFAAPVFLGVESLCEMSSCP